MVTKNLKNINSKSEYRNPKRIPNSNFETVRFIWFGTFGFRIFGIVSSFGFRASNLRFKILGDHGEGETPVPIPNTEVKPLSADGTTWVTVWESRTLPRLILSLRKWGI